MKYNKRTLFIQGNLDYYINLFFFPDVYSEEYT